MWVRRDMVLAEICGASVTDIFWSETTLILATDRGAYVYEVEGDCCSWSYFFDFYGVEKLLNNGPITRFESVALSPGDPGYREATWNPEEESYEDIEVYGYRLTTEHEVWGPQSSVLSFRNSSNGYYGGWMDLTNKDVPVAHLDGVLVGVQGYDLSRFEHLTGDKIG